jgi:hypothetical protein
MFSQKGYVAAYEWSDTLCLEGLAILDLTIVAAI